MESRGAGPSPHRKEKGPPSDENSIGIPASSSPFSVLSTPTVLVGQVKEVVSYLEIWEKVILILKGLVNSE